MIDTDKYEGHTPAPWRVEGELTEGDDNMGQSGDSTLSIHGDGLYIGEVGADYGIHETVANAQLIADAPLFLKEMRNINERMRKLREEIEQTLNVERQTYADGAETDTNIQGWIEALEYVLGQIDAIGGEEE